MSRFNFSKFGARAISPRYTSATVPVTVMTAQGPMLAAVPLAADGMTGLPVAAMQLPSSMQPSLSAMRTVGAVTTPRMARRAARTGATSSRRTLSEVAECQRGAPQEKQTQANLDLSSCSSAAFGARALATPRRHGSEGARAAPRGGVTTPRPAPCAAGTPKASQMTPRPYGAAGQSKASKLLTPRDVKKFTPSTRGTLMSAAASSLSASESGSAMRMASTAPQAGAVAAASPGREIFGESVSRQLGFSSPLPTVSENRRCCGGDTTGVSRANGGRELRASPPGAQRDAAKSVATDRDRVFSSPEPDVSTSSSGSHSDVEVEQALGREESARERDDGSPRITMPEVVHAECVSDGVPASRIISACSAKNRGLNVSEQSFESTWEKTSFGPDDSFMNASVASSSAACEKVNTSSSSGLRQPTNFRSGGSARRHSQGESARRVTTADGSAVQKDDSFAECEAPSPARLRKLLRRAKSPGMVPFAADPEALSAVRAQANRDIRAAQYGGTSTVDHAGSVGERGSVGAGCWSGEDCSMAASGPVAATSSGTVAAVATVLRMPAAVTRPTFSSVQKASRPPSVRARVIDKVLDYRSRGSTACRRRAARRSAENLLRGKKVRMQICRFALMWRQLPDSFRVLLPQDGSPVFCRPLSRLGSSLLGWLFTCSL